MRLNWKTIPKFVITLPRLEQRQAKTQKELSKFGIEFQFFYGIDKNTLQDDEVIKGSKGAMACALSHQALMNYALNEGFDRIVVMEDDVKLCHDFNERISYIEKNCPDFDMFMLGPCTLR